ncbi:hypothetical protein HPP92_018017 [Vanilla planifolia]|uniref:Uncharacterized protein n=1 Tax=Vanilla planifolia TaxID=51239 RepID=A0A835QET3_VANPL|nr:hypothetical protein HPP92_018017 [Vanilla planifolia]
MTRRKVYCVWKMRMRMVWPEEDTLKLEIRVQWLKDYIQRLYKEEIVQNLAGTGDRKSMTSEPYVHVEQPNAGPMGVASQSESGAMTPFSKGIQKRSIDSSNMHTTLDKQRRERLGARCYNCPNIFGSDKSCQVEFGSYCLWSTKHKEAMNDATVKKLKDQLFVARAYYPSISKLKEDIQPQALSWNFIV